MKLSILIPTIESRKEMLVGLIADLQSQIIGNNAEGFIQILIDNNELDSIGKKRNSLLERSIGEYVCFIDDDDSISVRYIERILEGIKTNPDCISLKGVITWDGHNPEIFEHSIKYSEWRTNETEGIKYERNPNHLNVIKSSIAKQFRFPEINHGEDMAWSMKVKASGLLKQEYYIEEILYHYKYINKICVQ